MTAPPRWLGVAQAIRPPLLRQARVSRCPQLSCAMAGTVRPFASQAVASPLAKRRRLRGSAPPSSSLPSSSASSSPSPPHRPHLRFPSSSSSSSSPPSSSSAPPLPSPSTTFDVVDEQPLSVALSASEQPSVTVVSASSPLLSSLLSPLLSPAAAASASASASAVPPRALSVLPLFHAGHRRLVFLSLASASHSLHIDLRRYPLTSPLPLALLTLLAPHTAHATSSASPSALLLPFSLPLLLPRSSTKRRLREVVRSYGREAEATDPPPPPPLPHPSSGGEGLQYLTPLIRSLCSLSRPPPASLVPLTCPLGECGAAEPPTLGCLQAVATHHSSLLSSYVAAADVSASLFRHMQDGVDGWGSDFRYRWTDPFASARYRWAVVKEVADLPRLRLPRSHRVTVVEAGDDVEGPLRQLRLSLPRSSPQLLGFDTETRPSFTTGVPNGPPALIQLSSPTHSVIVRVRPALGIPPALVALLVDPTYTKVGQEVLNDLTQLVEHYHDLPATLSSSPSSHSFLDLRSLSSRLSVDRCGLAGLTAGLMAAQLSKAAQMSNWSRQRLSQAQVTYAALDALVSLQLKQKLERAIDRVAGLGHAWAEQRGVNPQALMDLGLLPTAPAAPVGPAGTAEQSAGADGSQRHAEHSQQRPAPQRRLAVVVV